MTDIERMLWQAEFYANASSRQRDLYDRVMPPPPAPDDQEGASCG